jgi:serine/threonine protein kinase
MLTIWKAPEHFAIKRHRAEESFQIERKVLKAIVNKPGSSFIDLYATYEMNSHFHMIFPWAPADLGKYWEKVPLPRFTKTNILWMLDQCKRIAEGLSAMHNYKSREQFMSYDPHQVVQPRDADKVDPNELLYGQHGDIKPENLLWYCKGSSVTDINGKLVLADFGLSAFNHLNSRSAKRGFQGSISYSPPDVIQGRPMTRAYDVWSLGCVYLEFITWLIFGYDGIRNFRTYRFERTFQKQYSNDTFYTELDKTTAIVRETVGFWISHLRKQDRCSQMLQDFLYVIQERMLLIEPKNRIPSQELAQRLQQFYQNSLANENYLLPTKSGRHEKREASKEESRERADNRKALGFLDVEEKEDAVEEFIENDQAIMNSLVDISKEVDLPSNDALFV